MKNLLEILVLVVLLCASDSNLVRRLGDFSDNKRTEQVSFYRLRFELSTTSTASRVTLENISNVLTARRIGALNNPKKTGATMHRLWVASLTAGQLVGVTADYAITPDALREPLRCLLEKDPDGESTVRIYNVPENSDPVLLKEINHIGSDPLPCSVDLSPLQGTSPLQVNLPGFALDKMFLAFYYPWYHMQDWYSSLLQDKPATLYSSDDPVAIACHIDQAKSAGIGAFMSSWWGPHDYTDQNLATLLDIAQTKNFNVAINFETIESYQNGVPIPRDETTLVSWLSYAISNYGDHPAFLKVNGKPVIIVWASTTVQLATWKSVFTQVEAQAGPAIYIAELAASQDPNLETLDVFDGWHMYNILGVIQSNAELPILAEAYETTGRGVHYYPLLMESPRPRIWAATIQPGYDDHLIPGRQSPILNRENGTLYRGTFETAAGSNPDWILITSWNEWWEHTHIEPSVEFGDQYLMLTRELAEQWGILNPSKIFLPIVLRTKETEGWQRKYSFW